MPGRGALLQSPFCSFSSPRFSFKASFFERIILPYFILSGVTYPPHRCSIWDEANPLERAQLGSRKLEHGGNEEVSQDGTGDPHSVLAVCVAVLSFFLPLFLR